MAFDVLNVLDRVHICTCLYLLWLEIWGKKCGVLYRCLLWSCDVLGDFFGWLRFDRGLLWKMKMSEIGVGLGVEDGSV